MNNRLHHLALVVVTLLVWVTSNRTAFADSNAVDVAFFETHIRPVLAKHCYECHSAAADQLGGNLRLDQREAMRTGGESGPPIIDGDPEKSLLIQALKYDGVKMPPSEPLPASVVAKFERWIEHGAVDPRVEVAGMTDETCRLAEHEQLWSLKQVELPTLPEVDEPQWAANAIDRFVMARMEVIRDSMMAASGNLDLAPASGSIIQHREILVNIAGNLHQSSQHRSVYLCYLRSSPPPELVPFNLPDFTQVVGQRETTTLSSQTLYLLNSPFVIRQAKSLADRLCESSSEPNQRVREAFRYALQRDPREVELTSALALVGGRGQNANTHQQAWASFCQALLMTNEFRYVD